MADVLQRAPDVDTTLLEGPGFDQAMLEFSVSAISAAIATFGTIGRATLFVAAARACGPFGAGAPRPISINALATSLARPFETTRRNANALILQNLIARSEAGLCVPGAAIADPLLSRFIDRCHDLMVRMVEDLRSARMALPPTRSDSAYEPMVGTGIAFDLFLAVFECHQLHERNQTRIAMLSAVDWAIARFGTAEAIAPVKPSTVARLLGLPYATVSRHLDTLVQHGVLTRCGSGLVRADAAGIGATPHGEIRQILANRARQLLGRLAHAGFPMDRPATAYIAGRPAPPAMG